MAFLTGSRLYGQPKKDSDVDVVMRMDRDEIDDVLKALRLPIECHPDSDDFPAMYPMGVSRKLHMKNGSVLNLIMCDTKEQYVAWAVAGQRCLDEACEQGPLERERAVEIHKEVFGELEVRG